MADTTVPGLDNEVDPNHDDITMSDAMDLEADLTPPSDVQASNNDNVTTSEGLASTGRETTGFDAASYPPHLKQTSALFNASEPSARHVDTTGNQVNDGDKGIGLTDPMITSNGVPESPQLPHNPTKSNAGQGLAHNTTTSDDHQSQVASNEAVISFDTSNEEAHGRNTSPSPGTPRPVASTTAKQLSNIANEVVESRRRSARVEASFIQTGASYTARQKALDAAHAKGAEARARATAKKAAARQKAKASSTDTSTGVKAPDMPVRRDRGKGKKPTKSPGYQDTFRSMSPPASASVNQASTATAGNPAAPGNVGQKFYQFVRPNGRRSTIPTGPMTTAEDTAKLINFGGREESDRQKRNEAFAKTVFGKGARAQPESKDRTRMVGTAATRLAAAIEASRNEQALGLMNSDTEDDEHNGAESDDTMSAACILMGMHSSDSKPIVVRDAPSDDQAIRTTTFERMHGPTGTTSNVATNFETQILPRLKQHQNPHCMLLYSPPPRKRLPRTEAETATADIMPASSASRSSQQPVAAKMSYVRHDASHASANGQEVHLAASSPQRSSSSTSISRVGPSVASGNIKAMLPAPGSQQLIVHRMILPRPSTSNAIVDSQTVRPGPSWQQSIGTRTLLAYDTGAAHDHVETVYMMPGLQPSTGAITGHPLRNVASAPSGNTQTPYPSPVRRPALSLLTNLPRSNTNIGSENSERNNYTPTLEQSSAVMGPPPRTVSAPSSGSQARLSSAATLANDMYRRPWSADMGEGSQRSFEYQSFFQLGGIQPGQSQSGQVQLGHFVNGQYRPGRHQSQLELGHPQPHPEDVEPHFVAARLAYERFEPITHQTRLDVQRLYWHLISEEDQAYLRELLGHFQAARLPPLYHDPIWRNTNVIWLGMAEYLVLVVIDFYYRIGAGNSS